MSRKKVVANYIVCYNSIKIINKEDKMLSKLSIEEFTEITASSAPAPGGGSISALSSSLGAALGEMVISLTKGDDLKEEKEKLDTLRKGFLTLMEKDTEAFNKVSKALKMPRSTEEEKEKRNKAKESALKDATLVPMEVLKKSGEAISLLESILDKVNPNVLSDIGVGAKMLTGGIDGAYLNVIINLSWIKDEEFKVSILKEVDTLKEKYITQGERLYNEVLNKLKG